MDLGFLQLYRTRGFRDWWTGLQWEIHWFPSDDLFTPFERRRGLPIGNLTSQWLANLYLSSMDHLVSSHLGVGGLVRYCDDFVLLDNDRRRLQAILDQAQDHLAKYRLRLHTERLRITPSRAGLTFCGYRIWPTHRYLPKTSIRRYRRRLRWMKRAYAAGEIDSKIIQQRLASWLGHARQADSVGLIKRLSKEWLFQRASS